MRVEDGHRARPSDLKRGAECVAPPPLAKVPALLACARASSEPLWMDHPRSNPSQHLCSRRVFCGGDLGTANGGAPSFLHLLCCCALPPGPTVAGAPHICDSTPLLVQVAPILRWIARGKSSSKSKAQEAAGETMPLNIN